MSQCNDEGLVPAKIGLKLKASPTQEVITEAMKFASSQSDASDQIFIYYQIITYAPGYLDAYVKLIPLVQDHVVQQKLLIEALELAHQAKRGHLEHAYRKAATTMTAKKWEAASSLPLLPYPKKLKEFLEGECTIWSDKKRWETHIVVPLFPQVNCGNELFPLVNTSDKTSPMTPMSFRGCKLVEMGGDLYNKQILQADQEFRWGVLTYDLIPQSTEVSYSELEKLLPPGYHFPGVFDVQRALSWETQRSGKMYFTNETYTFCKERVDKSGRMLMGNQFTRSDKSFGADLVHYSLDSSESITLELMQRHNKTNPRVGVAGWRTFDCPPPSY